MTKYKKVNGLIVPVEKAPELEKYLRQFDCPHCNSYYDCDTVWPSEALEILSKAN